MKTQNKLTALQIRELLECYYAPLPQGMEASVQKYMELLDLWSKKINLTAIHDPEQVVKMHFGESIFAFSDGLRQNGRLADVGAGAGFPGLALKLAAPDLSVILIEPNKKKCGFLHEVVRQLALREVEVVPSRFEHANIPEKSTDVVVCRALGVSSQLIEWSKRILAAEGDLFLWLGREDCQKTSQISGWKWDHARQITATRERYILKGRPD